MKNTKVTECLQNARLWNNKVKLNGISCKQTLSAAILNFFAAIEGRNEYGNLMALRLFRSLHSINLNVHYYEFLKQMLPWFKILTNSYRIARNSISWVMIYKAQQCIKYKLKRPESFKSLGQVKWYKCKNLLQWELSEKHILLPN